MTDIAASNDLVRLMSWLSPAFPTGGFSYSHGLEQAVEDGLVHDADTLNHWLETLLLHGAIHSDGVLLAATWRTVCEGNDPTDLVELAEALAGSAERHLEQMAQGRAFVDAAQPWLDDSKPPQNCALSVAVGWVAGAQKVNLQGTLTAYLHAFISNQIQVALRLFSLGQQAGVTVLQALEAPIVAAAEKASNSSLDDLGSAAIISEICAMRHETLGGRVFRT